MFQKVGGSCGKLKGPVLQDPCGGCAPVCNCCDEMCIDNRVINATTVLHEKLWPRNIQHNTVRELQMEEIVRRQVRVLVAAPLTLFLMKFLPS
jgi:hypothetical protein